MVSRAAVREALRTLEVSGLVELKKGVKGGAYVLEESAPLTQSFERMLELGRIPLRDFTEARILISDIVVRLACERGTKKQFDAIERSIDKVLGEVSRHPSDRYSDAVEVFRDVALGEDFPAFLTLTAYDHYLIESE